VGATVAGFFERRVVFMPPSVGSPPFVREVDR
jgi:hypothetical protein